MRRTHLLALLILSALAVVLTWPLVTQITTHVPGSDIWAYDEYTFLWNIWYFQHALLDLHRSPLHTELLFYPLGLDLVLYTFNLMAAGLALPVVLATGNVPLASNLVNLASTVMGGFGAYLLALYLLRPRNEFVEPSPGSGRGSGRVILASVSPVVRQAAALLAGLIYAFASSRSVYLALGHYMIVTTQWVPFFALYLVRTLDRRAWRDAALAGLFGGLSLLTDMLYGVLLGLIAVVLVLDRGRSLWRPAVAGAGQRRSPLARLAGLLAVVAIVAAFLSAPLLIPTVREGRSADYTVEGWGNADQLSADLAGLVTPTALNPVLGGGDWPAELRAVQTGDSRFSDVNTLFLGYATLALAALGAITGRRRARPWTVLALVSGILALGPLLQLNRQTTFDLDGLPVNVPLPFIVLHYLPFIQGFRAPNRFSIVVMLALGVLAAFGAAWLLGRLAHRSNAARHSRQRQALPVTVAAIVAAVILFEHLAVPMPLTDARVPSVYRKIAAEPGDFALLQLPMGWRNGFGVIGSEDTRIEWYQSVHGRPILSGNTSRNPAIKFDYFRRLSLVQAITDLEMYQPPDPQTDQAARQSAADLMALWNVRYLVVNPPVAGRYPYSDTWQAVRDYALDVLPVDPTPVWDADGVQVYAVRQPVVPFPFELDLGNQDTNAYRGAGWSVDEADVAGASAIWATGDGAELFLPLRLDTPAPVQLVLRARPFSYPNAAPQSVAVEFNGVDLGSQTLGEDWQELRWTVPAEATRSGLNRVKLRFAHSARPVDVLPGQGMIGATGVQLPVDVEINSGGAAQDLAYITVTDADGKTEDASAGRRGYNLTAIDPRNGRILHKRGFDTAANTFEADRLADFVDGLPDGVIVLAAARGDAGAHLTERAVAALATLGSAVDLRATPSYGHALVGVKGAAPGAAAEATGADGAYLRIAADRRPLAVAVDRVRLEAAP